MKYKLKEYLDKFKLNCKFIKDVEDVNIEIFSGIKPSSYHVPCMLSYLDHPPYSNRGIDKSLSWFVEIWINGLCVWRTSKTNETGDNLEQYEEELTEEIMIGIFNSGIFNSWSATKEREINRHKI